MVQTLGSTSKEVEIVKLEGVMCAGRYKKCRVQGKFTGVILIPLLPAPVEAALNNLNEQEEQIAYLKFWIERANTELRHTAAAVHDVNRLLGYPRLYVKQSAYALLADAQEDLPKRQSAYAENLQKTRPERTVKIRNTGSVYQDLPVWECADPRKPERSP